MDVLDADPKRGWVEGLPFPGREVLVLVPSVIQIQGHLFWPLASIEQ
jgi:hypothetical protein